MPLQATMCVRETSLVPQPAYGVNKFTVKAPNNAGHNGPSDPPYWCSFQNDGTVQYSTNIGEYELGTRIGDNLFFQTVTPAYPSGCQGVPIAVGM